MSGREADSVPQNHNVHASTVYVHSEWPHWVANQTMHEYTYMIVVFTAHTWNEWCDTCTSLVCTYTDTITSLNYWIRIHTSVQVLGHTYTSLKLTTIILILYYRSIVIGAILNEGELKPPSPSHIIEHKFGNRISPPIVTKISVTLTGLELNTRTLCSLTHTTWHS